MLCETENTKVKCYIYNKYDTVKTFLVTPEKSLTKEEMHCRYRFNSL